MVTWLMRQLTGGTAGIHHPEPEAPLPIVIDGVTPEEVFYLAAARFLDVQVSTNDVFDNRTTTAFSIGSTVLPVTFGLLSLSAKKAPAATVLTLVVALVAYVVLVFCVWRASRIRVLSYRPNMIALQDNSEIASGESLRRWVASEYVASTEFNQHHLERKGIWVGRGVTALYVEGFLLSLAAIFTLL